MSAWQSVSAVASGFSTRQWMPRSSNGPATSACSDDGTAIEAASISAAISCADPKTRQPWRAAASCARAGSASTTPTSSTPFTPP
jgi:hypothetical protein